MHKAYNAGMLNRDGIELIMSEQKANQRETVKVSAERLQAVVLKGMDAKKTEDFIIKACEHYKKYLQLSARRKIKRRIWKIRKD